MDEVETGLEVGTGAGSRLPAGLAGVEAGEDGVEGGVLVVVRLLPGTLTVPLL